MIPGLDGLRAIAILLVFLFHANLIAMGWAGVLLFFSIIRFLNHRHPDRHERNPGHQGFLH